MRRLWKSTLEGGSLLARFRRMGAWRILFPALWLAVPAEDFAYAQNTDFEAVDILFKNRGDGEYDVTPLMRVALSGSGNLPLHVDVLVDGEVVVTDKRHNIDESGDPDFCSTQDPCDGRCQVDVTSDNLVVMYPGSCNVVNTKCVCVTDTPIDNWPSKRVPIPEGSIVTIVIDPENLVDEFDETNNSFSKSIAEAETTIPTLSGWGLLALAFLMFLAVAAYLRRVKTA